VAAPTRRLKVRDLDRREIAVIAPLIALIIATGVYPQPLIDLIRPAVSATISDVGGNPHGITPVHTVNEGK
jgi:NADH-quinone oxidoreductase subunit M